MATAVQLCAHCSYVRMVCALLMSTLQVLIVYTTSALKGWCAIEMQCNVYIHQCIRCFTLYLQSCQRSIVLSTLPAATLTELRIIHVHVLLSLTSMQDHMCHADVIIHMRVHQLSIGLHDVADSYTTSVAAPVDQHRLMRKHSLTDNSAVLQ
jgi:hypothetical protein